MSVGIETVGEMIAELAALLDLDSVVEEEGRAAWLLRIDETHDLVVEYELDQDQLHFSAEVASVPLDRKEKVYEWLLLYNGCWQETGGMRMALEGPEGPVIQAATVAVSGLDLTTLHLVVSNFFEKLLVWEALLTGGIGDGDAVDASLLGSAGMIRIEGDGG